MISLPLSLIAQHELEAWICATDEGLEKRIDIDESQTIQTVGGAHVPSMGDLKALVVFVRRTSDNNSPNWTAWKTSYTETFEMADYFNNLVNSSSTGSMDQENLSEYFDDNSFQQLNLYGDIHPFIMTYNLSDPFSAAGNLAADIMNDLDSGYDFSDYDNWTKASGSWQGGQDNKLDLLIIVVRQGFWATGLKFGQSVNNDGITYANCVLVDAESWYGKARIYGVLGHEVGHQFGLYEDYGPNNRKYYGGRWTVMSNASGYYHPHEAALVGWVTPTTITQGGYYELLPYYHTGEVYKINIPGTSKYYLIHNMQNSSNVMRIVPSGGWGNIDEELVEGPLITKINSSTSNSKEILCADGNWDWGNPTEVTDHCGYSVKRGYLIEHIDANASSSGWSDLAITAGGHPDYSVYTHPKKIYTADAQIPEDTSIFCWEDYYTGSSWYGDKDDSWKTGQIFSSFSNPSTAGVYPGLTIKNFTEYQSQSEKISFDVVLNDYNVTYDGIITKGNWTISNDINIDNGGELTIKSDAVVTLDGASIYVHDDGTLIVEEGAELRFDYGEQIKVWGSFIAEGTDTDHIIFTSTESSPSAGDWVGIRFEPDSDDPNCKIKYADIDYATYGVYCSSASPTIEHSDISNCSYGIRCLYSSPTITFNTLSNNSSYGIYLHSSGPKLRKNAIKNNSGTGVRAVGGSNPKFGWGSTKGNNTIHDNYNGITANASSPFLGLGDCTEIGGYNSVFDNSNKNVIAQNNSDIEAELTYWEYQTEPTIRATFTEEQESFVRIVPFLETDPNFGLGKSIGGLPENLIADMPYSPGYDGSLREGGLTDLDLSQLDEYQLLWYAKALFYMGEYDRAKLAAYWLIDHFPDARHLPMAYRLLFYIYGETQSSEITQFVSRGSASKNLNHRRVASLTLAMINDIFRPEEDALAIYNELIASEQDDWITAEAYLGAIMLHLSELKDEETAATLYKAYTQRLTGRVTIEAVPELESDPAKWFEKSAESQYASTEIPADFSVSPNYPNPFNPVTEIAYALPKDGLVNFTVYDLRGRTVFTQSQLQTKGHHTFVWNERNNSDVPTGSGLYLYVIRYGDNVVKGKMLLLK
jgi:parallel beta-helix repeat protein